MNYNFAQSRKQKIAKLTDEGKVLKKQAPIVAAHFATAIFENTVQNLVDNESTDKIYDSNNPKVDSYEVSFKNPSSFFLSALSKAEADLETKTVFQSWITTETSGDSAVESSGVVVVCKKEVGGDDESVNHLWRKNWKTWLCSKIVEQLNKKFDSVEQTFYCDVIARGGRKIGKLSSMSYDSGNFNKVIVKIGDNENDPTQDIFDSLFRPETHRSDNYSSNRGGLFSFFSK
jgi:hypothetical protein